MTKYDTYTVFRTIDTKTLSKVRRKIEAIQFIERTCKETETYAFVTDAKGNVVYEYKQKREPYIQTKTIKRVHTSSANPF